VVEVVAEVEIEVSIRNVCWPKYVLEKWQKHYPGASIEQQKAVEEALKDWFDLVKNAHPRKLGMPSRSVDLLWHELILETKFYEKFCSEHVGFFVHHSSNDSDKSKDGQRAQRVEVMRTWMGACALEGVDYKNPSRLPRLFASDGELKDELGFKFSTGDITQSDATNLGHWF
jgi:hypothetical protein